VFRQKNYSQVSHVKISVNLMKKSNNFVNAEFPTETVKNSYKNHEKYINI